MKKVEILGLETIPRIEAGDDLAEIITRCSEEEIGGLEDGDVVVLTCKITSKAAGLTRRLGEVEPGKRALAISRKTGKDARWLQMILDEGHTMLAILPLKGIVEGHIMDSGTDRARSAELVEHEQAVCVTMDAGGRVHTCDAGIDGSNLPGDLVSTMPTDPDAAAASLRQTLQERTGKKLAVILSDTQIIPFGTMDLAIGSAGIEPRTRMFGKPDMFGRPKFGGIELIAYEMTAACALLFGQTASGIPAAVIRGCDYRESETANIGNTLWPRPGEGGFAEIIRRTLRSTAAARPLKARILLRIASWFV
jgi:coenzyme F420-0:L-glutamate ligase/coenzyme F420-1:gamma-L-glutamate ligase